MKILAILFFSFFVLLFFSASAQALTVKYPKIANYYLVSNINVLDYEKLSQYDLLILPMEAQYYDRVFLENIKQKKPDIILLPYVPIQSINISDLNDPSGLRSSLIRNINSSWWLKDQEGKEVYFSSETPSVHRTDIRMVNPLSGWQEFLPRFIEERLLSAKLWDGVFFDMVDHTIDWLNQGNLDLDHDRRRDDSIALNLAWQQGIEQILKNTRARIGEKFIIINGSSYEGYQQFVNGRMFEDFPTPWLGKGRFEDSLRDYLALPRFVARPPLFLINMSTRKGQEASRRARFGLISSLLGDGYFSFDDGIESHQELYWFEDYIQNLGLPLGDPYMITLPQGRSLNAKIALSSRSEGVPQGFWRRDFEQGVVVLNATEKSTTISFPEEFEIKESPSLPSRILDHLTLNRNEGAFLIKPISELWDAAFMNGVFIRIFNKDGISARSGFFVQEPGIPSQAWVLKQKTERKENIITSFRGVLTISPQEGVVTRFKPFPDSEDIIRFALIDSVSGRNNMFVFGASQGKAPLVKVVDAQGILYTTFFAYNKEFRGGVEVASADITGSQGEEIITGPRSNGGPHVRVFTPEGRPLMPGFFAFSPSYRGGISVAAGDLQGDGKREIVVGRLQGDPLIRVFTPEGVLLLEFLAFDRKVSSGVHVQVQDIDHDGRDDILVWSPSPFAGTQ